MTNHPAITSTPPMAMPISPIPHLLGSNRVPTKEEALSISSLISNIRLRISHIDADIRRTQAILDPLIQEREALQEFTDQHSAFLSPWRQLPDEIWSEIFIQFLSDNTPARAKRESNCFRIPTIICSVCTGWRAIALATPVLWSSIDLTIFNPYSETTAATVALTRLWLDRSKQSLLTLRLHPPSFLHNNIPLWSSDQALQLLVQQSHRWKIVDLNLPEPTPEFFSQIQSNLPQLKVLRFSNMILPGAQALPTINFFENAPQLSKVHTSTPRLQLPWDQLVYLFFDAKDVRRALEIMKNATNLKEFKYHDGTGYTGGQVALSPAVHHLQLRRLSIETTFLGARAASGLLDNLHLPAIDDLAIFTSQWYLVYTSLESFASRCCQSLRYLHLKGEKMNGRQLSACLEYLPALLHVSILKTRGMLETDHLVARLHVENDQHEGIEERHILVPCLTSFALETPERVQFQNFVKMVESRWKKSSPRTSALWHSPSIANLQSAILLFRAPSNERPLRPLVCNATDLGRCRKLKDEGLQLEASSFNSIGENVRLI